MLIPDTQQTQSFQQVKSNAINTDYLLYLPKDYDIHDSKRWPLLLFLHGSGEQGNDLSLVAAQGLPKMLQQIENQGVVFPFVVVSPQSRPRNKWRPHVLSAILDEVVNTYNVDTDRISITGLSMGGYGTWALAIAYPHRFAAIAPICGGGDVSKVCSIQHLPVWTFHGALDKNVPIEETERMVEALKACGGNVRFTVYPTAGHDSWTATYNNTDVYDWFLEHRRADRE